MAMNSERTTPASDELTDVPFADGVRSPALLFQAYIEFMKVMVGNIFLINAGSATAFLTLLGRPATTTPAGSSTTALVSDLGARYAIVCFAVGAALAVAATACLGLQENRNSDVRERRGKLTVAWGRTGFALFVISGLAFCAGCLFALFQ